MVEVTKQPDDIEKALEAAVDPWLQHMSWRADYARWREDRLWQEKQQAQHLRYLESRLSQIAGKRILDVGCGMGGFITALKQRGADARGLDFNFDYCRITDLRGLRYDLRLEAIQAAGERLPFRDASFDAVTCWDILEHVSDPQRVLVEVQRVLKPGGYAFVTVVNRLAARDPHFHLYWVNWLPRRLAEFYVGRRQRSKASARFRDRQALSEMHYFTFSGFERLACRSGWQVVDLEEEKLRQGRVAKRSARSLLMRVLRAFKLDLPAFKLHRLLWRGTYHLALQNPLDSSD